jgi:hypothetical protein
VRAWTLGYPPGYEKSVRVPGNAKVPGGYLFRTRADAEQHAATHDDVAQYGPYEIELPAPYDEVATRNYMEAARARHEWHLDEKAVSFMRECGVCTPRSFGELDHDLLLVCAPFVNPDTGTVVPGSRPVE